MNIPARINLMLGLIAMAAISLSPGGRASEGDVTGRVWSHPALHRVRVQGVRPIIIRLSGLDSGSRYVVRTYFATWKHASNASVAGFYWGAQRPLEKLLADYQDDSGNRAIPEEVLPCALPDAIETGGLRRNWRSGSELMEQGLEVAHDLPGDVLWITYEKVRPSPDEGPEQRVALDGEWQIATDPGDNGKERAWNMPSEYPLAKSRAIQVPGNVNESFPQYSGIVWYRKTFSSRLPEGGNLESILRFRACSYRCDAWLNGVFVGSHEGGEAPFEFIVSRRLNPGANTVIVRVFFPKGTILDGGSDGPCAYPVFWGMGGLTQGVDLVSRPLVRISDVYARTDWKTGAVIFDTTVVNSTGRPAQVKISANYGEYREGTSLGTVSDTVTVPPGESVHALGARIEPYHLWNLEDPFLYSVRVRTEWDGRADAYEVPHFGFRDFRVNPSGYFELNGKRLFVKCTHSNVLDPLCLEGTPRDMTWLGVDFEILKAAGFNTYRLAAYSAFPEQLDIADELGFLIYDEHQSSWLMKDTSKFELGLPEVIRRDRNHPSLVIWGLLNEVGNGWPKEQAAAIYHSAVNFLPKLRKLDNSRVALLSSGRFDRDFRTGCESNPGSSDWNVYLGGEDSAKPDVSHTLFDGGPYQAGAGDVHVYESFPIRWEFIENMARITRGVKPLFLSEGGQGSAIDPIGFARYRLKLGAPSRLSEVIEPRARDLEAIWTKYRLNGIYPNIEDMLVDSQKMAADQRALFLNIVRSNPGINGYNLTSMTDGPDGEGFMDLFRHFKAGHYKVVSDGWAKLRWCLLVNPSNAYSGRDLRIRASLANEDVLPQGDYPARLSVSDSKGAVWSQVITVRVQGGPNPPLAYPVFDREIHIGGLAEGRYVLSAALLDRPNAKAESVGFNITDPSRHPQLKGVEVTVLGVEPSLRKLLTESGLVLHDYAEDPKPWHELILVGGRFKGDEPTWRALHARIAGGAFALFLAREVLADTKGVNQWIPVDRPGKQTGGEGEPNILRSDIIACNHPIFKGLGRGVMTPDLYGDLLRPKARFSEIAVPDEVAAVWLNLNTVDWNPDDKVEEGVVIGIYKYGKGRFLINGFDLVGNIGRPAADRLILNMLDYGRS